MGRRRRRAAPMGPVNVAGLASLAMVSGGKPAVRHPGGVRDVALTFARTAGGAQAARSGVS